MAPRRALWLLASLVLVAILYGRALGFGFVHDDLVLFGEGTRAAQWGLLGEALGRDLFWIAGGDVRPSPYWRPVITLSYFVDHALGGGAPRGFHLSNLLGLGVLAWLSALLGLRLGLSDLGAWLVALAVLVHPMQVEAAVHISARTDLFMAIFATGALILGGWPGALATGVALGCKETALVLPALIFLLHPQSARGWVPSLGVVVAWLLVRQLVVAGWDVDALDAGGPTGAGLLGAGASVFLYLGRLLVPVSPVAAATPPTVPLWLAGLAWLALVGAALVVARRWSEHPRLGVALACTVLPILPASGLLNAETRYAEGFLCWPLVGLGLVAAGLPRSVLLVALPAWFWVGQGHVGDFRDEATLWASARADRPDDPLIAVKAGRTLRESAPLEALAAFEGALQQEANPRRRREAHEAAAEVLLRLGRPGEALPHLRLAADPTDVERAWALLARCVLESGSTTDATPALAPIGAVCVAALSAHPDNADLANSAGIIAIREGRRGDAASHFKRALELSPGRRAFQENLARALGE